MIISIVSILASLALITLIFILIYKGKLKEQYAIIWLGLSLVTLFFSIFRGLLDDLADIFGIYYAPSLLFLFAFFALFLILIQLSVAVSKSKNDIKKLSQEVGILKNKLNEKNKN